MSKQKQLIKDISEQTGVTMVWMAKQLEMSRQLFNARVNKDQLTQKQIIKISLLTKYGNHTIEQ